MESSKSSSSPTYRVGDRVVTSGIYRAIHGDPRLAHELTLVAGDAFPRCKKCGTTITFELLAVAPVGFRDIPFRVRLYEIPHPKPESDSDAA